MALNNMTTTASYGVVRDHLAFYNALVPKQKTSVAPRAVVPLCDTVLLLKGKPQRWLCSDAKQEATEKMHVDKESIHATFRQYGLCDILHAQRPESSRKFGAMSTTRVLTSAC